MTLTRKKKVVVYITCGDQLLVFRHRDFPEVGVQVPAGTIEPDETDYGLSALREAEEETGLKNLRLVRYLGSCDYDISALRPEMHERHFYHVEVSPPVPDKWLHYETKPSGGEATSIAYDCYWMRLSGIGVETEGLFLGQGAMLDKIKPAATPKLKP